MSVNVESVETDSLLENYAQQVLWLDQWYWPQERLYSVVGHAKCIMFYRLLWFSCTMYIRRLPILWTYLYVDLRLISFAQNRSNLWNCVQGRASLLSSSSSSSFIITPMQHNIILQSP